MVWAGPSEPVVSAESAMLLPPRPRPSPQAGPSKSHTAEVITKCLLETRGISRGSLSGTAIPSYTSAESLPLPRSLGKICRELLENYQAQALCCASGIYWPITTADTSALRAPRVGKRLLPLSRVDREDRGWGSSYGQEVPRSPV